MAFGDDFRNSGDEDYDPNPFDLSAADADDGDQPDFLSDDSAPKSGTPEKYWYVIHCYSGQEKKVCQSIEQRIATMGMRDRIFDVLVPTAEEVEIKDGKRRKVERRVFPGYILVEMIMDEDSWYVVRNTPGVTGFVGMGNEPTPLRPEEVKQITDRMATTGVIIKHDFKVGQKVRITSGPFNDFPGVIAAIDPDKSKVRVMVNFFGRDTPVELDFVEVERT
ncbi:MAG: transcription termination/antitermination factor NusG [Anaerolineae bacterium]|nr:transcription termination/antitermination factor NusG [Anaerolineae bacterium]